MINLNLPFLQRKYPGASVENSRIKIPLNPSSAGLNIYLDEGIWRIQPKFIDAVTADVLNAMGLTIGTKEAGQIRRRVIILPNNLFLFEFMHVDFKG